MVLPAAGADVIYRGPGGMKDVGGPIGVPVPAPVPIPEYKSGWYFRADIGLGILEEPDLSESGLVYGNPIGGSFRALTGTTFGTDGFLNFGLDRNALFTGGVGLGYYFSPHLRGDLTASLRSESQFNAIGSYSYAEVDLVDAPTGNTVFGSVEEKITLRGTLGLANIYYDITSRGRFKPYIGAGIGFVLNEVTRSHTTTIRSADAGGNLVAGPVTFSGPDQTHQVFNLAAAAMVGFTYRLYDSVSLDLNYRYLYMGGPSITSAINGQMTTLNFGDMHEHQIRAGFRYDID
jgi:opacity protein-like surface antigen